MSKIFKILTIAMVLTAFSATLAQAQKSAEEARILAPQITIYPQTYIAGEQTMYLEGKASPDAEITIYLKEGDETVKRWLSSSDANGSWQFSTNELIKSGDYYLAARAEKGGIVSDVSEKRDINIQLSGVSIGSLLISFKVFVFILLAVFIFLCAYALFFLVRGKLLKNNLKKETWEAKEMLRCAFENLDREIGRKIENIDSQPGFSDSEKRVYEDLHRMLLTAKISIEKEISDIENIIR